MEGITLKPGWKMARFGDVVRQCKEKVDRDNNPFERYVEGGHMDSENIHIRRWGEFGMDYVGPAFHRIFRKGQVLYGSRRTYLKKVALAEFDGITANTTFVCETIDQKVFLQELLPFLMLTDSFTEHSIRESKGSTNPYINWPDIAKYEFPLPPLDEQKRIAEILWAADEVAEQWQQVSNILDLLMSVYRFELFSNNIWPKTKLKNIFSVQLGKMLSPKAKTGISLYPYLANYNIQWDRIDLEKIQEMDFSEREREKFNLLKGDILVCEGGEVGRSAIWHGEIEHCYYQKALHRLRPISNFSSEIMLQFMVWADRKGIFKALTGHSTIAHLTAIKLKEVSVPVPSDKEQVRMEHVFKEMKSVKSDVNKQISKAIKFKQSLLCSLLSIGIPDV